MIGRKDENFDSILVYRKFEEENEQNRKFLLYNFFGLQNLFGGREV